MEEALQFDNEGDYTLVNGASVWIAFPGTNLVVHLYQSDDEVHAEICDDRNEWTPLASCSAVAPAECEEV